MRKACCWLFILFIGCAFGAGPIPSPTCPPGVKNCVPPSPPSAAVVGDYPIEVTSSLPKDTWKKEPFGAATLYTVRLAADSAACGTCTLPASIEVDQYGRVTSCTPTPPSPAQGLYTFPSNLLVSSEGLVLSVSNNTDPPLPANASFTVRNHADGTEEAVECCEVWEGACVVWSSMMCQ